MNVKIEPMQQPQELRHFGLEQADGAVAHYWHGAKANRKYTERWNGKASSHASSTPRTHLKRDSQCLWQLEDHNDLRSVRLGDALRNCFH